MKVLLNEKNVVVGKGIDIQKVSNGFFIPDQNIVYAPHGLHLEETNLNPRVQQDKLVKGKIEPNLDYKSSKTIREEFKKMREESLKNR
jgi:hypothetical protein